MHCILNGSFLHRKSIASLYRYARNQGRHGKYCCRFRSVQNGLEASGISFDNSRDDVFVLFGQAVSLLYSLAGAVLSLSGMILIKKTDRFSSIAVSVAGGVLHNVGQIIAACLITETKQLLLYLPVLLITGTISGIVIGLTAGLLNKRIEKLKI